MNEEANKWYQAGVERLYGKNSKSVDYGMAYKCLSVAAEMGHALAMNDIGYMFENNLIDTKNPNGHLHSAFGWYLESAYKEEDTNSPIAVGRYNLARMFATHPDIVSKEDSKNMLDIVLHGCSVEEENEYYPKYHYMCGLILMNYCKDYEEAGYRFLLAIKSGRKQNSSIPEIPEAYYYLGRIVSTVGKLAGEELNGTKRTEVAISFYKGAAELGHVEAMYELAVLYGQQVEIRESVKWFERAAEKGHEGAKKKMKVLKFLKWSL